MPEVCNYGHSTKPPGEHRYENWTEKKSRFLESFLKEKDCFTPDIETLYSGRWV